MSDWLGIAFQTTNYDATYYGSHRSRVINSSVDSVRDLHLVVVPTVSRKGTGSRSLVSKKYVSFAEEWFDDSKHKGKLFHVQPHSLTPTTTSAFLLRL